MTPKYFYAKYKDTDREHLVAVAEAAGTNFANLQQIAIASGSCGKALAKRLAEASGGEMSVLEILYPEDYEMGGCADDENHEHQSSAQAAG